MNIGMNDLDKIMIAIKSELPAMPKKKKRPFLGHQLKSGAITPLQYDATEYIRVAYHLFTSEHPIKDSDIAIELKSRFNDWLSACKERFLTTDHTIHLIIHQTTIKNTAHYFGVEQSVVSESLKRALRIYVKLFLEIPPINNGEDVHNIRSKD